MTTPTEWSSLPSDSRKPLAIVPCRLGSKGVPLKNITPLNGVSPVVRAVRAAKAAGCSVVVTSEANVREQLEWGCNADWYHKRPDELAEDDSPMIDVVRDVLAAEHHNNADKVVLVQCTQPLRTASHVTQALALLAASVDSVVSVVELPQTYSPDFLCVVEKNRLKPYPVWEGYEEVRHDFWQQPTRRQDADAVWMRDGTAYCFWRKTVTRFENIYGEKVVPLIIDPSETCALDTPSDWAEAERRLREREAQC